jgi:hypothetical protein
MLYKVTLVMKIDKVIDFLPATPTIDIDSSLTPSDKLDEGLYSQHFIFFIIFKRAK